MNKLEKVRLYIQKNEKKGTNPTKLFAPKALADEYEAAFTPG